MKTAFLHGTLERDVYMKIPKGFYERNNVKNCTSDEFERDNILKLKRSIYGLKISPKRWYNLFDNAMSKLRFEKYPNQPCLYVWREKDKFALLLLYVDDMLVTSNCKIKLREIEERLKCDIEINNLGEPKKFLGIEIERDRTKREIKLHQRQFINKILKRFEFENDRIREQATPMNANYHVDKSKSDSNKSEVTEKVNYPFRQVIGSLLYLQGGTRPDLTYSTNVLSRCQSNYTSVDISDLKKALRYLRATKNLGLIFRSDGCENLVGYPDASLGFNDKRGLSTSGYIIFMFGDPIAWRTKKQKHVALSSAEAEYIAMSLICKEVIYLQELMRRVIKVQVTAKLYEDNVAAIEIARTEESNTLKHIVKLCYHYVKDLCKEKSVIIEWVKTENQLGDFFTKPLPKDKFIKFRNLILANVTK